MSDTNNGTFGNVSPGMFGTSPPNYNHIEKTRNIKTAEKHKVDAQSIPKYISFKDGSEYYEVTISEEPLPPIITMIAWCFLPLDKQPEKPINVRDCFNELSDDDKKAKAAWVKWQAVWKIIPGSNGLKVDCGDWSYKFSQFVVSWWHYKPILTSEATIQKANKINSEYLSILFPTYILFEVIDVTIPRFGIIWTGDEAIEEGASKTVKGRMKRIDCYKITKKEYNTFIFQETLKPETLADGTKLVETDFQLVGFQKVVNYIKTKLEQREIKDIDEVLNSDTFLGYVLHNNMVEVTPDKNLPIIDAFGLKTPYGTFLRGWPISAPVNIYINFDFDKYEISNDVDSNPDIQSLIRYLRFSQHKIEIIGHTDKIGTREYNLQLSKNRANAFKEYLKKNDVASADSYNTIGMGYDNPIATNDTESGRAKNRRIEIKYLQ